MWAQDYRLGPEWTSDPNFKFQMFSNDILSDIIVIKVVTKKTVRNLNSNFKFLSDGNFRWWAFRNYAYFVMKPSECDTVMLRVWPLHLSLRLSYVDLRFFRMLLRWKFSNLNFESKKVYRTLLHPPAVNLQYFLCIITQFKGCYKVVQPTLDTILVKNRSANSSETS